MGMKDYFVILFLFTIVIIGANAYLQDLTSDSIYTAKDLSLLNKSTELQANVVAMDNAFRSNITGITIIDLPIAGITGLVSFTTVLRSMAGMIDTTIDDVAVYILPVETEGIPYVSLFKSLLAMILIFEALYFIVGRRD